MRPIRILLVEDDPGHRLLLTRALTSGRPALSVSYATNRAEFHAEIASQCFDCVVTDFCLQDCFAEELLATLHALQPDCPALVVSGRDDQDVVIRSMRQGSVDFVPKDDAVEGDRLWDRIRLILADRRRQRVERRRTQRRLKRLTELVHRDALTGLANRRSIDTFLGSDRRKVVDRRGETSVVMLDIDHFKQINDRFGHAAGDEVLRRTAAALRDHASEGDVIGRWGGEEFLILKPGTAFAAGMHWAEIVRQALADLRLASSLGGLRVTASFGVHCERSDQLCMESIDRADHAMYLAKRRGRNRVCSWSMAVFDRLLHGVAATDPGDRLTSVLERGRCWLGPTQFDHLTAHSSRVSRVAADIGERLAIRGNASRRLAFAGLAHDIGKFYIPDAVLAKPGPLLEDERLLLARHASDGADAVSALGGDATAADSVRYHHLRFDSMSAADLRAIPLEARILNVADAVVTMTSDQPYRPARSRASAVTELRRHRAGQFDPIVADATIGVLAGASGRPTGLQ